MSIFIPLALADDSATSAVNAFSWSSTLSNMAPLLAIVVVFYFLVIRPQQKRMKDQQSMLSQLKKGDRIVTLSGIYGTITKVDTDDSNLIVEIAPEVKIKLKKESVAEVRN